MKQVGSTEIWARQAVLHYMREIYVHDARGEEDEIRVIRFDRQVRDGTSLSQAFSMLSPAQRYVLRRAVENPTVVSLSGGKRLWIDDQLDVLARLEGGVEVGPTNLRAHHSIRL